MHKSRRQRVRDWIYEFVCAALNADFACPVAAEVRMYFCNCVCHC